MLDLILNNSIVICPSSIKNNILLESSKSKTLKNIKFITIKDFIDNYYGTYDINAIYYVMKKYKYSYDVTIKYLDNLFYNYEDLNYLYKDLLNNNYLIFNELFKSEVSKKQLYLIGYSNIDKYVINDLESLNTKFLEVTSNEYKHQVYECITQSDELKLVLQDIIKNHINELDKVFLVNVSNDYKVELKRLSKLYHININLNDKVSIYSSKYIQLFINNLKQTKDINKSLELIEDIDIKNKVIDILNKYTFDIDDISIDIIDNVLKHTYKDIDILDNAINIINIDDINNLNNYYYILNFNQGIIPATYHDDDLISDDMKSKLNLNTSFDKVLNNKNNIIKILNNYPNIFITYKLKDNYNEYIKSPLIDELNLEVIKYNNNDYSFSNELNKLTLAKKLDDYYKFNIEDKSLYDLYTTYKDINYDSYDNKFNQVEYPLIKEYLKDKLTLSYSSINNYFHCAFKYYISNILKLDIYEETFNTLIGNLYHHCLSKMYEDNFDLKKEYNEFLSDKELTNKERFFINNLYSNLEYIIKTIKYQESKSKYNKTECEKNIRINIDNDIDTTFLGFVDKIKIYEENDIKYVSIIDYKTGSVDTSLDNINHGFNLQLPVYIYLIKKSDSVAKISGFYFQELLHSLETEAKDVDKSLQDNLKLIGYTIDDESLIQNFDSTYEHSEVIKGMALTQKGFAHYTKLFNEDNINTIVELVNKHINEVISAIKLGEFNINPKRINDKLIGCQYCKFKDICYKKEEDVVTLQDTKTSDILGGEE